MRRKICDQLHLLNRRNQKSEDPLHQTPSGKEPVLADLHGPHSKKLSSSLSIMMGLLTSVQLYKGIWDCLIKVFLRPLSKNEQCRAESLSSVQSLSRVQLCDPVNHSTPGLPVQHQLSEFTKTHVHRAGDAIQSREPGFCQSCPLSCVEHFNMEIRKARS